MLRRLEQEVMEVADDASKKMDRALTIAMKKQKGLTHGGVPRTQGLSLQDLPTIHGDRILIPFLDYGVEAEIQI
jgi:hypothetical protein